MLVKMVVVSFRPVRTFSSSTFSFVYPALKTQIALLVNHKLQATVDRTKECINFYFDTELAYMNTDHPQFVHGNSSSSAAHEKTEAIQVKHKGWLLEKAKAGAFRANKEQYFVQNVFRISTHF